MLKWSNNPTCRRLTATIQLNRSCHLLSETIEEICTSWNFDYRWVNYSRSWFHDWSYAFSCRFYQTWPTSQHNSLQKSRDTTEKNRKQNSSMLVNCILIQLVKVNNRQKVPFTKYLRSAFKFLRSCAFSTTWAKNLDLLETYQVHDIKWEREYDFERRKRNLWTLISNVSRVKVACGEVTLNCLSHFRSRGMVPPQM